MSTSFVILAILFTAWVFFIRRVAPSLVTRWRRNVKAHDIRERRRRRDDYRARGMPEHAHMAQFSAKVVRNIQY